VDDQKQWQEAVGFEEKRYDSFVSATVVKAAAVAGMHSQLYCVLGFLVQIY
jgi:hypothetical protein